MNVVIYARYSSHNQNEQSIEGQLEYCRKYAKDHNYNIIHEYIDRATTGTNDNRPQFLQMIEDSNKKTFEGILVYQLDRFARNRYDSAIYKKKLSKNGVRVFSSRENISDDASGVLMESVLEGMAEYFSVELGQKIKRGMKINAENCYYNGGSVPLGLKLIEVDSNFTDVNGKIVKKKKFAIDEETVHIVKEIFDMYAKGKRVADIINYLNDKGIKTGLGKEFNKNSLRKMLLNKKYVGIYNYKEMEIKDGIPRIIDDETFNKVQDMMKKNKKAPARARAKTEYLLTTKLFCGHCKEMMTGHSGTSKTGKLHTYYKCNNSRIGFCDKKPIQKDYIEDLVVEQARNLLTDDNINKIAETVVKLAKENMDSGELKRLNRKLKELEKQKNNLFNSLKMCDIDTVKTSIFEEIQKIEVELTNIKNEIAIEESQSIKLTVPQVRFFLTQMRKGNIDDIKYRRLLINTLVYKVYLYDDSITIIFNTQNKTYEKKIPRVSDIESSLMGTSAPPLRNLFELFELLIYSV